MHFEAFDDSQIFGIFLVLSSISALFGGRLLMMLDIISEHAHLLVQVGVEIEAV